LADRTDCGRQFHTSGPATENALLRNLSYSVEQ